ncbi:kinase-like domain-containing protein [Lineolata rhizophorae]|uniref:Kinase-like domain-containing protein n=1 Tax=Lineolata rhizophorae TaxID=578093 RepID=A0A6A6NUL0_9PEZI|nr:kinase-like domain-containing protein [Lineolata rhizophorae]
MEESEHPRSPKKGLSIISYGVSGIVLEASSAAVIKIPLGQNNQEALDIEQRIYKLLGAHPSVTKLLDEQDRSLVLERLQVNPSITKLLDTQDVKLVLERLRYPLRKRLVDLSEKGETPLPECTRRWALQLTEALQHVHSRGVMQVDIGGHNALLDWDENVKLSDFAGSYINGSKPLVSPDTSFSNPNLSVPSISAEIFALGSMLYEVETTRQPYYGKPSHEIQKLFASRTFPDTRALILGEVIRKCWQSGYNDTVQVLEDIKGIR